MANIQVNENSRDNDIPIRNDVKTIVFADVAGEGEFGTVIPVFTVTGVVLVHAIFGLCTEDLVGASATLSLGTTTNVAQFIGLTTAVNIDLNEFWYNATPVAGSFQLADANQLIVTREDIILDPLTADITDGTIDIYIVWEAISTNGNIS